MENGRRWTAPRETPRRTKRLMQELRDTFHLLSPTGQDLVKYRPGKSRTACAYSLRRLMRKRLFAPGYVDVTTLCRTASALTTGAVTRCWWLSPKTGKSSNRLPLQYLQGKRREDFIVWTNSSVRDYRKRQNLCAKSFRDEAEGFRQRNSQDTQHMARFLYNYISDHLAFAQSEALE